MSDEPRKPFVLILGAERRRVGRPVAAEPRASSVTVRLRPAEHDRIVQLAIKHDVSVSALVRAILLRPRD